MTELFGGTIKASTLKLYTHNLKRLNNNKIPTDTKFLKKVDEIMESINGRPKNTARSYLIAVVSALKKPEDAKLYAKYYPYLEAINKELKSNTTKSEKQTENWINQNEILTIQKEMLKNLPKKSKKELTKDEYDKLLYLVVLSLYTLQAPRRLLDYQLMKIEDGEDTKFNYYNKGVMTFNNFKTAGKYSTQIQAVPKELNDIIKVYLKFKPKTNNFLLNHYDSSEFKHANEITRILNKIFGKKLSVSMMRNIYLSSKYTDVVNNLNNDTENMGTSTNIALNQYIKTD